MPGDALLLPGLRREEVAARLLELLVADRRVSERLDLASTASSERGGVAPGRDRRRSRRRLGRAACSRRRRSGRRGRAPPSRGDRGASSRPGRARRRGDRAAERRDGRTAPRASRARSSRARRRARGAARGARACGGSTGRSRATGAPAPRPRRRPRRARGRRRRRSRPQPPPRDCSARTSAGRSDAPARRRRRPRWPACPSTGARYGMHLEHRLEDGVAEHVLRVVLGAADLLQHHLDLARDLDRIEDRVLDGVGEHVEAEQGGVGGQRGVVAGGVERGEGVDASARALDGAGDLADAARPRALEEHVLVEVRESGLVRALVGRAHAAPRSGPRPRGRRAARAAAR